MNTFLISFETYPPSLPVQRGIIENKIRSFGAWARPTSFVWLIKTPFQREIVMNVLRTALGPNDKLLVMKVDNEWIAFHLSKDVVNWMQQLL